MSSGVFARVLAPLALIAVCLPSRVAGLPPDMSPEAIERIVSQIDDMRTKLHVPGAALAIVSGDRVLCLRGLGLRDVQQNLPVTPDTQFAIGSCTKAFTAAAAMMSVDDGKLSLSASPRVYLPYFRLQDKDADAKITVSDLLCHRSGLARTDLLWYPGKLRSDQLIRAMADVKPTAKLGERFQYQNVMYLAAGEIVAKAQRMGWDRVLQRRIFSPLGMRSTGASLRRIEEAPDHALGYSYNAGADRYDHLPMRDLRYIAPAGAINSTARDMAQWLRFMVAGGQWNGRPLISPASFAQLTANHIAMGSKQYYGYGWMVRDWNGQQLVEHGGNIDGFAALVSYLPDERLGMVLLTNVSASPLGAFAQQTVFTRLSGSAPAAPAPVAAAPGGPAVDPRQEAGTYLVPGAPVKMTVALSDGKLTLSVPGQPPYPLELVAGRRYRLGAPAPPGFFATFRASKDDATITEIFLEQPQGSVVVRREAVTPYQAALSADDLMTRAAGALGAEGLRKHRTLVVTYTASLAAEGLRAAGTIWRSAPGRFAERYTLTAVGKRLGTIREYCDGKLAGIDGTIGNRGPRSGDDLADAVIAADFLGPLRWRDLYKTVTIKATARVGDEETYVVEKVPARGSTITDYYSVKSYLLLRRDGPGTDSETFGDYRSIDGVMIPFRRERAGMAGASAVLTVTSARFDAPVPASAFRAPAP